MTLLNPAAFLFAALVPIVVLLYLLKIRRRDALVSTLRFWQKIAAENRRRTFWQKLRRPLSLLLQLLLLALVLFALARPESGAFFTGGGSSTVVVLDARARMQARDAQGRSRFEEARAAAAGFLRRASSRNEVALLTASARPQVLVPLSADDGPLLSALNSSAAGDAAGSLTEALALANELLASRPGPRRIVVVTDEPPARQDAGGATMEWIAAGTPRDNVGITQLAVRRLATSSSDAEILFEIVNHGSTQRAGSAEFALDGRVFDLRPYDLAPGQRQTDVFATPPLNRLPANARGWITARWQPADGRADALGLDDIAYAVAPLPRPRRVLLVTAGNPFLERSLAADDSIRYELLAPAAYDPAMAANFDVVILDQPENRGGDVLANLPQGNFLFVRNSPIGVNEGDLDRPIVTDAEIDDPLLRLADLREVNFLRAAQLPFDARRGPLRRDDWLISAPLRSLDHALILVGEREPAAGQRGQRFVALAFGVTDSDLPLRIAFPLLMHNAVHWLAGGETAAVRPLRAGEVLLLRPGESISPEPSTSTAGADLSTPAMGGEGAFAPVRNGFYLLRDSAGAESWVAVNTFDDDTSNASRVARSATLASGSDVTELPQRTNFFRAWPPWVYLAAAALFLSTLEWMLYHRRQTE
jgi:Aerotolerance regulator N-terminal/von Willebrand factor type A domain